MAADATAANYLATRQAAADPMGAYAAGVAARGTMRRIDLAEDMGTMEVLLNMSKLSTERAELASKEKLAQQQLEIAKFNADTNRINALRPRAAGRSSAATGGPGSNITWHPDGSIDVGFGGESDGQFPTTGEGDGVELPEDGGVVPLEPGAPQGVSLFPQGGAMQDTTAAPLAGMGRQAAPGPPPQASFDMQGHSSGGDTGEQPAPQQPMSFPGPVELQQSAASPGPRKYRGQYVPSTINPKTGSMTLKRVDELEKDDDAPVIPAPPEVLQKLNAIYEGFGKVAVPTNDKAYRHGYKFDDKPELHGKGIESLSADEQKRFGDLTSELMNLTLNNKLATPEAKMAAMGVTNPKEMTEEMWQEGWNRVQNDPNTPVDPAANAAIMRKATELAGFKNLMFGTTVNTPQGILEQMGIDTKGMFQQQSTGEQWAGDGAKGKLPAVVATAAAATGAQQPAAKAQTGKFLVPEKGPEERDAAGFIVRKAPPTSQYEIKRQGANEQWESTKKNLFTALQDTVDMTEFTMLREGTKTFSDPGMGIPASGETPDEVRQKWVDKNVSKLAEMGIKTTDGKPPKMDSVIFVDHTGRSIKLREILDQMFKDERYSHPEKKVRESEGQAPSGRAFTAVPVSVGKPVNVR